MGWFFVLLMCVEGQEEPKAKTGEVFSKSIKVEHVTKIPTFLLQKSCEPGKVLVVVPIFGT